MTSARAYPRVISIACQKGGSCKTTTTLNLGAALHHAGRRVLLIDLDPQGDLTLHCGHNPDILKGSMIDVLREARPILQVVRSGSAGPDIAPASLELQTLDMEMALNSWRLYLLREMIAGLRGRYDYILVDTPPAMNLLTYNALQAAGEVVIPMLCEYFSLRGMRRLAAIIREMQRPHRNPMLRLRAAVACRYDARKKLARESLEEISNSFPDTTLLTVRDNVSVAEASGQQRDIFSYSHRSAGAEDYHHVAWYMMQEEEEWFAHAHRCATQPSQPHNRAELARYLSSPAA
jgi:chromosome partitioning protein